MAADDLSNLSRLLQEAADQESEDPFTSAQWAMIDERLGRILRNYLYANRYRRTQPGYLIHPDGTRTLLYEGGERISEQVWAWRYLDHLGIIGSGERFPPPGTARPPDIEANRRAERAQARNAGIRPRHDAGEILAVLAEAFRDGVTGWKRLAEWRAKGDRRKRLPTKKVVITKLRRLLEPDEETLAGARRLIDERGL
jgi:hypothetical protein